MTLPGLTSRWMICSASPPGRRPPGRRSGHPLERQLSLRTRSARVGVTEPHHDEGDALVLNDVVQGHRRRVVEPGRGPRLPHHPGPGRALLLGMRPETISTATSRPSTASRARQTTPAIPPRPSGLRSSPRPLLLARSSDLAGMHPRARRNLGSRASSGSSWRGDPPGWPSVQPVVPDVHNAGHVSAIRAPTPRHRLRGAHGHRPRTGQALRHPEVFGCPTMVAEYAGIQSPLVKFAPEVGGLEQRPGGAVGAARWCCCIRLTWTCPSRRCSTPAARW